MKLQITTENSISLASVINTMIMFLMKLDEMYAEDTFSKSSGSGSIIYEFDIQKIDDLNHTKYNNACQEKNEIMYDKYFKVVDLFHQDPVIKLVSLSEKISHLNSNCDNNLKMRKNESSNQHKLNGINQVDKINTTIGSDFLTNLYLKKEITLGSNIQEKTNELHDKIIITSNNLIVNMPTCVEEYNKLQNNKTPKLFTTHNKKVEIISHFKPSNSQFKTKLIDKILKTRNKSNKVMRKIRQIDLAESTLTFNNNRNFKTLYQTNPINLLKRANDANENLIVKNVLKCNDTMESIINSSPKFDFNEDIFIPLVEKRPVNDYYTTTRSAQTNKSTSRPKLKDKPLKRSKATVNYKIKKYCNKDFIRNRKTITSTIPDENNTNLSKINNIMNENVNKIQSRYKPIHFRSKSPRARHKLPYAKTMNIKGQDVISKNTEVFILFNSSHLYPKVENTNDFNQTTFVPFDIFYGTMRDKLMSHAKNQGYRTTRRFLGKIYLSRQSDNKEDDEADGDDDDITASDTCILGEYNSHNNNHNGNDNRYDHYTHALTNENNVNNVLVINFRTTRHIPTAPRNPTCPSKNVIESPDSPALTVIRDEFVMDQNILMAILFTSIIILVIATCCCAPIMLIKKNKESRDTQGRQCIQDYSSSDTCDTA